MYTEWLADAMGGSIKFDAMGTALSLRSVEIDDTGGVSRLMIQEEC